MKYKSDVLSLFLTLLFLFLGFAFLTFFPSFDFSKKQLSIVYYISNSILLISFVIYFITDRILRYYKLEKKTLIIKKFFTKDVIPYKNIFYLDEEKIKKGVIKLYTKDGKRYTLILDRKNLFYSNLKKKCHDLISQDEFKKLISTL